MNRRPPGTGWVSFGTHVGDECPYDGPLVLSEAGDDNGWIPDWEWHEGCQLVEPEWGAP